jgi:hypothetical protein
MVSPKIKKYALTLITTLIVYVNFYIRVLFGDPLLSFLGSKISSYLLSSLLSPLLSLLLSRTVLSLLMTRDGMTYDYDYLAYLTLIMIKR